MGAQDELWQMYGAETSKEAKKAIQQALFVGGAAGRLIELARVEKDPELRRDAVRTWASSARRGAAALEPLYASETDRRVREAVLQAFFVPGNAKRLIEIARTEKDPGLKRKAVQHLSVMGSPEAHEVPAGAPGEVKTLAIASRPLSLASPRAHGAPANGSRRDASRSRDARPA